MAGLVEAESGSEDESDAPREEKSDQKEREEKSPTEVESKPASGDARHKTCQYCSETKSVVLNTLTATGETVGPAPSAWTSTWSSNQLTETSNDAGYVNPDFLNRD